MAAQRNRVWLAVLVVGLAVLTPSGPDSEEEARRKSFLVDRAVDEGREQLAMFQGSRVMVSAYNFYSSRHGAALVRGLEAAGAVLLSDERNRVSSPDVEDATNVDHYRDLGARFAIGGLPDQWASVDYSTSPSWLPVGRASLRYAFRVADTGSSIAYVLTLEAKGPWHVRRGLVYVLATGLALALLRSRLGGAATRAAICAASSVIWARASLGLLYSPAPTLVNVVALPVWMAMMALSQTRLAPGTLLRWVWLMIGAEYAALWAVAGQWASCVSVVILFAIANRSVATTLLWVPYFREIAHRFLEFEAFYRNSRESRAMLLPVTIVHTDHGAEWRLAPDMGLFGKWWLSSAVFAITTQMLVHLLNPEMYFLARSRAGAIVLIVDIVNSIIEGSWAVASFVFVMGLLFVRPAMALRLERS
jgi:hypothetical protein